MQKNYSNMKNSSLMKSVTHTHTKSGSNFSSQRRKKTCFNFWSSSPQGQQLLHSILEAWQMVSAVGMEISKELVLKYLQKRLTEKSSTITNIILSTLRERRLPRL